MLKGAIFSLAELESSAILWKQKQEIKTVKKPKPLDVKYLLIENIFIFN